MKKLSCLLLVLSLLFLNAFGAIAQTLTGVADSEIGGKDAITVQVEWDENGVITEVKVIDSKETAGVADPAIEQTPEMIIKHQSLAVDAVAGATMTSEAIVSAVRNALTAGGVDVTKYEKSPVLSDIDKEPDKELAADVVVVGAGGAGMAAAVQAHQCGASVIIVEKMPKVGGNTILSGGALNAVDDRSETAVKQNDSVYWYYKQTYEGGDKKAIPELVFTLVNKAWDGVTWLKELGMEFYDEPFMVTGGLWARAHRPVEPVGTGFFKAYMNYVDNHNDIDLMLNTKAEELIQDENGRISGVICTGQTGNKITLNANKGVVIATGGFARNVELRQAYNIQWGPLDSSVPSTNHPGATGDAVKMLMKVGADMIQMGNIQLHPMGDPKTGSLSGNLGVKVNDRVFINQEGKRFVNEGGRRDILTRTIFEQPGSFYWNVMDSDFYPTGDEVNGFNESANALFEAGRIIKADSVEDLAEQLGVPFENLKQSLDEYNSYCEKNEEDPFGRTAYGTPVDTPPFYATKRVPTVHHTMGGVHINTDAQVLSENGEVIKGLFAAGEVTGGIHGANRLGGNALTDILVFGRIAGENAANAL